MGSKLAVLAAVAVTVIATAPRIATAGPTAAEYMAKGGEAFKAGRYDAAISFLAEAYKLERSSDILFALAQAERLGGYCDKAIPHYKQVLSELSDIEKAKLVQSNLTLCERATPPPPAPDPVPVAPPPAPTPAEVPTAPPPPVEIVRGADKLAIASATVGAIGLGFGLGLHLAANGSRDDAAVALTLGDSRELHDRADRQRLLSITSFVVGGSLVGYAVFRWVRSGDEQPRQAISVAPSATAPAITWTTSW